MNSSSTEHIDTDFERLRALSVGAPPNADVRRNLLRSLRAEINRSGDKIRRAVYDDFRKSTQEAELTEIATVLLELKTALSNLERWMAPKRVRASFPFWTTKSMVATQPRGVVLVISPWNYPVLLSLAPVILAIAAGNRIVLKPSERTPHTSQMLADLVDRALGADWCSVIQGGPEIGAHLLTKPFDHFYFTGSPQIGQIVARAAAEQLSSVTLELGGKSPAIVDDTVDVNAAAEKIVVGKYLNAGQTCIAPDFVLAHELVFDRLVEALVRESASIKKRHRAPISGIVDERHAGRLMDLWHDASEQGAVLCKGEVPDLAEVSVITRVPVRSKMMTEEIFGPLLPVLRFSSIDDILGVVAGMGEPLTVYVFTRDRQFVRILRERIRTGSICQNEVLLHFGHPALPFGGVGNSGYGRTHGYSGFKAFSNEVSILRPRWGLSILPFLFPVTGKREERIRRWFLRWLER